MLFPSKVILHSTNVSFSIRLSVTIGGIVVFLTTSTTPYVPMEYEKIQLLHVQCTSVPPGTYTFLNFPKICSVNVSWAKEVSKGRDFAILKFEKIYNFGK